MVGAAGPDDRGAGEGDDLDIDHGRDASTHLGERGDVGDAVVFGGVGVGAHRDVAVGRHQPRRSFGALDDVVVVDPSGQADHRVDGSAQVAGLVGFPFGEEGLVEMGVGFDRRRQQQPALEVDGLVGIGAETGAHGGDHAVHHQHVDRHVGSPLCHGRMNNRRLP